jgi:AraC-like DNA-binding protein
MSSNLARTFSDPDDYAAAVPLTTCDVTITGRGRFEAKVISFDVNRLRVRQLSDNLPRVVHCIDPVGYAGFSFRTQSGPSLRRDGLEISESAILQRAHAQTYFQRSDGFARLGAISLPVEVMASIGATIVGSDLTPPKDTVSVTPLADGLYRLHRLFEAAVHLAEYAPSVVANPGSAYGLEQALVEALAGCFTTGGSAEDRSALRRHAPIMRKFYDVTESNPERALFIPDLCAEIGVGERTLRICCEEYLGTSPSRYLMLRRMRQARKTLRESDRNTTTVTEIAAQWGFWNFGRFAGEYKSLFGELPSVTLANS